MASGATRPRAGDAREPGPVTVRGWLVVVGGVATGAVILAAWLPVGALLNQRAELSSASSHLAQLSVEGRVLAAESARLATPEVQDQLARAQYELVEPGQRLIQVLTPSFHPTSSKALGSPFPGDPGYAPLANPTDAAGSVSSGGGTTAASSTTGSTGAPPTVGTAPAPGYFSRVLATLEFWR